MKDIITTITKSVGSQLDSGTLKDVLDVATKVMSYRPYIGVFGETGNGKSSLCNALFGQAIAEVSHHASCTRDIQAIPLPQGDSVLLDVPGISETGRTEEYLDLYHELCTQGYPLQDGSRAPLDLAIWAIPASSRAYANAQMGIELLRNSGIPLIVVLTKADEADEGEWDYNHNQPDAAQLDYLERRRQFACEKLGVTMSQVVTCAADRQWHLNEVIQVMLSNLPSTKRAAVAKSIRPQLSTQRVKENVEKGLFDTFSEFITNNKGLINTIIEIVMMVVLRKK